MNILMLSLYYPDECYEEVAKLSRVGMQNQANSYQKAFIEGIDHCLQPGESLSIVNGLPVGIFPLQYRKCILPKTSYQNGRIQELGGINLPYFKQKMRASRAKRAILDWAKASPDNRVVLMNALYLPYLQAVAAAKKVMPELRAAVIVTDLPNEYGLGSGRKGLLRRIERRMGQKQLALCQSQDGFVLMAPPMAEVLPCENKKTLVIEGLIQHNHDQEMANDNGDSFEVLYTGTLSPELGIQAMLDAFAAMPDVQLRICGGGIMADQVAAFADAHENIHFEGFVPHEKALALQAKANALINPRSPEGLFTRYSFPSKTLEYMRSGKPVLCYKLEGIPADYGPYLRYITAEGGIQEAVRSVQAMPVEERIAFGKAARDYVITHKNPIAQCTRLVDWLRSL